MKIVILDAKVENPGDISWEGLSALGELTIYDRTSYTESTLIADRIGNADIVITNKTPISKDTLVKCRNIKMIAVLATGFNDIDTEYAKKKGIPVCNVPTYGTYSVSQYAIALLLEICHHIGEHSASVRNGEWSNNEEWCYWKYPLIELYGKSYGLLGCGNIGIHTAEIAKALGMKVLAYDINPHPKAIELGVEYVSLDKLFRESDVLGLQMPLLPFNTRIINRDNIKKMKDGAILINNSRGQMIDEEALAEALNTGKLAAAALDVLTEEPVNKDNPLLKAKNCIITPHISWAAKESRQRIMDTTIENIKAFINGTPQNVVNQ